MSSTQLGRVLADRLIGEGIDTVICPGSRSTPLTLALAERADELPLWLRSEERSAAFTALGIAKVHGLAAIVITSGTAVGNLLPAVMEASQTGVGLLLLTADRPATLQGSLANQTCNQRGIFSSYLRAEIQLNSSDWAGQQAVERAWAAQFNRAVVAAAGLLGTKPGPVQLNLAFAQPLYEPEFLAPRPSTAELQVNRANNASPTLIEPKKMVIVAGDATPALGNTAQALAERAALPLFAEPSSNARRGPCAIARYRELLNTELAEQIEQVLLIGHPTLSRPVSKLLARPDIELIALSETNDWPDAGHQVSQLVNRVQLTPGPAGWLAQWQRADFELAVLASGEQSADCQLTGQLVAEELMRQATGNLVFGASNPIRDAELAPIIDQNPLGTNPTAAWLSDGQATQTKYWANRGLAGIDGLIATASGIALASQQPTTLLLGDISFLHDLSALHLPAGQQLPKLRIVVADDDGGSIFRTLEVGKDQRVEQYCCMPHGKDLAAIVAGFGYPCQQVTTLAELQAATSEPPTSLEVVIAKISAQR